MTIRDPNWAGRKSPGQRRWARTNQARWEAFDRGDRTHLPVHDDATKPALGEPRDTPQLKAARARLLALAGRTPERP